MTPEPDSTLGSLSLATVSAYEDSACGASRRIGGMAVNLGQEGACLPAAAEPALGSIGAEWDVSEPGDCTPVGGASAEETMTICCLPEPAG
ncbi:hypothetical protein WMF11_30890 [Sorangium sp. So ce295]|uniref:hypothetical protein n=1 Tax=Sorangium sp. So ce295 TaxID=3133295 RepID=UPI003F605FBD